VLLELLLLLLLDVLDELLLPLLELLLLLLLDVLDELLFDELLLDGGLELGGVVVLVDVLVVVVVVEVCGCVAKFINCWICG